MGFDYKVRLYNPDGILKAELTDFLSLGYKKIVNSLGVAQLIVSGQHEIVDLIADKWIIEIWRRNVARDIDWYKDFTGIFSKLDRIGTSPGEYSVIFVDHKVILSWAIIAWYSGFPDRSKFVNKSAETIVKTLVSYNMTSSATIANGRIRDFTLGSWTVNVETDGGGGEVLDVYCSNKNLLETLASVAQIGNGDFDLVKTGPTTWEFKWFDGQLGMDSSSTITFGANFGNLTNVQLTQDLINEKTVAIIGGQEPGENREFEVITGNGFSSSNEIEIFVDARDVEYGDSSGLVTRGAEVLSENKRTSDFLFDVIQTSKMVYGQHYDIGYLVSVISPFDGTKSIKKIKSVVVTLDEDGSEHINIETEDA